MDIRRLLCPSVGLSAFGDAAGSIDEIQSVASILNPARHDSSERFARGEALSVRGWIGVPTQTVVPEMVMLRIDERYEIEACPAIARPDVAAALRDPRYLHTGFVAIVSTLHLDTGVHRFSVHAFDSESLRCYDLPTTGSFSIEDSATMLPRLESCDPERIRGNVDEIEIDRIDGASAGDVATIFVRGWACDMLLHEPAAEVFGTTDAGCVGRATLGFARPDVSSALDDSRLERCGFRLRIFADRPHFEQDSLRLTAISADRQSQAVLREPG